MLTAFLTTVMSVLVMVAVCKYHLKSAPRAESALPAIKGEEQAVYEEVEEQVYEAVDEQVNEG